MKKAFTLIELVVAIAILAMMSAFAGVVFNVSIDSHRTGLANAEIMRRLRAITSQLDADFKGLRKDGEIFVVWEAVPAQPDDYDYDGDGHVRFDRIMFFTGGDFQSYGLSQPVRGNVARISYMLANDPGSGQSASEQPPERRILARTQHILTADPDPSLVDFLPYATLTEELLDEWHNQYEYDRISLVGWKNIPWMIDPAIPDEPNKPNILSAIAGIFVHGGVDESFVIGSMVGPTDSNSIHNLLCQGVGEFKVQGWYDPGQRWVPEAADGDLDDLADPARIPGVLYHPRYGGVNLGGELANPGTFYLELLNEERFDEIPGLGRALMFTFTLYDSRGIIGEGRTFTHIVYLGD